MTGLDWLSFRGRIGRRTYWVSYVLPLCVISVLAQAIDGVVFVPAGRDGSGRGSILAMGPTYAVTTVLSLWPWLAASVKQMHDRDRSGWLVAGFYAFVVMSGALALLAAPQRHQLSDALVVILLAAFALVFVLALWMLIEISFLRGTAGANRFGPDPLKPEAVPTDWQALRARAQRQPIADDRAGASRAWRD